MDERVLIYPVFVPMVGCPHQCAFCNQRSITGRSITNLLQDVKTQLEQVMSRATIGDGKKEIAFFGGSFTCLSIDQQNTFFSLARPYLEAGYAEGIRISTRPDYLSDPVLENLQQNGLTTIELGVQSTDSEVLKASERGYTYEEILPSIHNLKNYDFKIGLQMMTGLPCDNRLKSIKTALDFVDINPDFVRIYPTLVVKGSALEENFRRGEYNPLSLEEAIEWVRDLRIIFELHDIDVIRMGLHSQEGFDRGDDLIAGPYHPAFGEMVESAIYRMWMDDIIGSSIAKSSPYNSIVFRVHTSRLSQAIGQKRGNLLYLYKNYPDIRISVQQDRTLDTDEIKVLLDKNSTSYRRKPYILHKYQGILREMGK